MLFIEQIHTLRYYIECSPLACNFVLPNSLGDWSQLYFITTQNEVDISLIESVYSMIPFVRNKIFLYVRAQLKTRRVPMVAIEEKSERVSLAGTGLGITRR